MTSQRAYPIGMFDSGVGGLTVMHQLIRGLPKEDIIYFGDTARLPYGDKSRETIIRYSLENTEFLLSKDVKLVVVACSTASASALDVLKTQFSLPVIGTIEPGAAKAVAESKDKRIAVLGTKGTINSGAYVKAIHACDPKAFILPIACPLFVPLVEEQFARHPAARMIVEEYLRPIREQSIDTIVLGCTHYPLIKEMIADVVGNEIKIIDSALACAEAVKECLTELSLDRQDGAGGIYEYFVSDDPEKFRQIGKNFLGMPIERIC